MSRKFEQVEHCLKEMQEGRMIILVDDHNRENEGDLVLAAQFSTPERINFMAKHGRGLICLSLEEKKIDELRLPMMTEKNEAPLETAFTVSVEAREGVSTGISAHDRSHTIQTLIKEGSSKNDYVVPGHIFPLKARKGGVLVRAGHTEASVDLARLCGLKPSAVICEILKDDGSMARMDDLKIFAKEHDLSILSIAELIDYRLCRGDMLVEKVAEANLPNRFSKDFKVHVYRSTVDQSEHVALVLGSKKEFKNTDSLVRVHSECLTGDVFSSLRCDCGEQLDAALEKIVEEGRGVLLYLRQEGRGIGLINKIKAYSLQEEGMDTVEANKALGFPSDLRTYGIGAQILRDIGLERIKILSNNPKKIVGLDRFGIEVVERVPLRVEGNDCNVDYLATKKTKMGHLL